MGNALSSTAFSCMATEYARACYEEVKKEVTGYHNSGNVSVENGDGNAESFVGFIQIFSDKMATPHKNATLVVYTVCAILLHVST